MHGVHVFNSVYEETRGRVNRRNSPRGLEKNPRKKGMSEAESEFKVADGDGLFHQPVHVFCEHFIARNGDSNSLATNCRCCFK
jgi:hypothetical protein